MPYRMYTLSSILQVCIKKTEIAKEKYRQPSKQNHNARKQKKERYAEGQGAAEPTAQKPTTTRVEEAPKFGGDNKSDREGRQAAPRQTPSHPTTKEARHCSSQQAPPSQLRHVQKLLFSYLFVC